MKKIIFIGGILLASNALTEGQSKSENIGISIEQGGEYLSMTADSDNVINLVLSKKPFNISYPNGALNLCAWTDKSIYEKAKVGVDAMQDFTSCLFIYKSIAMPGDATYIYLSSGEGSSLNSSHGATKLSDKRSTYHVTHFERKGKDKELEAIQVGEISGAIYVVAWMDRNKNKMLDKTELERFKLEFK